MSIIPSVSGLLLRSRVPSASERSPSLGFFASRPKVFHIAHIPGPSLFALCIEFTSKPPEFLTIVASSAQLRGGNRQVQGFAKLGLALKDKPAQADGVGRVFLFLFSFCPSVYNLYLDFEVGIFWGGL